MNSNIGNKSIAVVTGGMGFIGSHLVERLVGSGKYVVVVDVLGAQGSGSFDNIKCLDKMDCISSIVADTCWGAIGNYIEHLLEGRLPSEIYYLASPASPVHYLKYPLFTIHSNTTGLENFLKLANKWNATILYTSTSEIYGDPDVLPQPETYNGNVSTLGDRSVYDEAKRLGETLMMTYFREYKTRAKIVRLFNSYGPRMAKDDGRVIPAFICNALQNKPLQIMGDGTQTRSFCYVDDTVKGILEVMQFCKPGEAYNIGNRYPQNYCSIAELASIILDIIPTETPKIEYIPFLSQNDPKVRMPDTSKLESLVSWRAFTDLKEGLAKTIKYFATRLQNEN